MTHWKIGPGVLASGSPSFMEYYPLEGGGLMGAKTPLIVIVARNPLESPFGRPGTACDARPLLGRGTEVVPRRG